MALAGRAFGQLVFSLISTRIPNIQYGLCEYMANLACALLCSRWALAGQWGPSMAMTLPFGPLDQFVLAWRQPVGALSNATSTIARGDDLVGVRPPGVGLLAACRCVAGARGGVGGLADVHELHLQVLGHGLQRLDVGLRLRDLLLQGRELRLDAGAQLRGHLLTQLAQLLLALSLSSQWVPVTIWERPRRSGPGSWPMQLDKMHTSDISKSKTMIKVEHMVYGSRLGQFWPEFRLHRPDLGELIDQH